MKGSSPHTVTLVPASFLSRSEEWRPIANALPPGVILLVVPDGNSPLRTSLRSIAQQMRRQGRQVAALSVSSSP